MDLGFLNMALWGPNMESYVGVRLTKDFKLLEDGPRIAYAAIPPFFGLEFKDSHVPTSCLPP